MSGHPSERPDHSQKHKLGVIAKWLGLWSCATVPEAGGNSSVVEHDLAKVGVAGSNPVSRSTNYNDNTSSRVGAFRAA